MPLSITSRVENDIVILDLEGALTLGPSLQFLRETARQSLTQSRTSGVIVNVKGVTLTDSAGLGELTVVYTLASKRGCRMILAGVGQSLRTMLEVTHLDGLLPIASDIAAAKRLVKDARKNEPPALPELPDNGG